MWKLYDVDDITEGTFPLHFKIIFHYQCKYYNPLDKLKWVKYIPGFFVEDGILFNS